MKSFFVSSTFKDMQAERDHIHNVVGPEIQRFAREKNGMKVDFCDLRWGIVTADKSEEEAHQEVLETCLREIARCKPYMIVMLGERYGTSFEREKLLEFTYRHGYVLAPNESNRESVTELEIEYGALSDTETFLRTVFLFREPIVGAPEDFYADGATEEERQENKKRLESLKRKIREKADSLGVPVLSYSAQWDNEKGCVTGLEEFEEKLVARIKELLEQEDKLDSNFAPWEKEERYHWRLAQSLAAQFKYRNELLQECIKHLEKGSVKIKLTGSAGSGKSVLFSKIAVEMRDRGWNVYPFSYGCGNTSQEKGDMYRQYCRYLEGLLGKENEPEYRKNPYGNYNYQYIDHYKDYLDELLDEYEQTQTTPLLLMADIDWEWDGWSVDEDFPQRKNVSCLCSYRSNQDTNRWKTEKGVHFYLGNYPVTGKEILSSALSGMGKGLHPAVVKKLLWKCDAANPAFLQLIISRLEAMDREDFAGIDVTGDPTVEAQLRLLDTLPDTLLELYLAILEEAAERFGEKQTRGALGLIALSKGMRRSYIRSIYYQAYGYWSETAFSRLLNYLPAVLIESRYGEIVFLDDDLEAAVRKAFPVEKTLVDEAINFFRPEGDFYGWNTNELLAVFREKQVEYLIADGRYEEARREIYAWAEEWRKGTNTTYIEDYSKILERISESMLALWEKDKSAMKADFEKMLSVGQVCDEGYKEHKEWYLQSCYRVKRRLYYVYQTTLEKAGKFSEALEIAKLCAQEERASCYKEEMCREEWVRYTDVARLCVLQKDYAGAKQALADSKRTLKIRMNGYWDTDTVAWYESIRQNAYGKIYESEGKKRKAQKAYKKALKCCKRRVEFSFSLRRRRWKNGVDTLNWYEDFFKRGDWRALGGESRVIEMQNDFYAHTWVVGDSTVARVYERKGDSLIALNFYRSAVEKAEKLKADKRGSVDEAYYDWLWVMCLQAYISYCFKITESSWHFRKDILIQCYRALEFLQDMNKRYDSVDLEDTIAVTVYTIACLYYVAGDREEYLTEAKSLAKDLYKKTGKLRYKWLLKDVEKAMQSIRKKKKRLPTLEGE